MNRTKEDNSSQKPQEEFLFKKRNKKLSCPKIEPKQQVSLIPSDFFAMTIDSSSVKVLFSENSARDDIHLMSDERTVAKLWKRRIFACF